MLKKPRYVNTFVMRSEKLKELKNIGFSLDEVIILKEELGKAKKNIKK